MTKSSSQFSVEDRVESGQIGTDDYDTGKVVAIDGDEVTIAWDTLRGATTRERVGSVSGAPVKEPRRQTVKQRHEIARNPSTPADVLKQLGTHKNKWVRWYVANSKAAR